jgi:hypothetical protein
MFLLWNAPAYATLLENNLPNGSFEDGDFDPFGFPAHWNHGAWQPSAEFTWAEISHDGAWSVRINHPVANDAAWIQTVQLAPDTSYVLSGWIKTQNVSSAGAGANLCLWGTTQHSPGLHGTNDWTHVRMFFDSGPTGQVTIGARLGFWAGTSTGTAWFDDLRVTPVDLSIPADDPNWKVLVLIYGETDFTFLDGGGVPNHVVASMTEQEKSDAAAQATRFFEDDVPLLNSGNMTPTVEVRYPAAPLSQLTPIGAHWWPAPDDTLADRDPAFDAVIVVWDPRGQNLTTGLPMNLNGAAGLAAAMGVGQTYATIYAQGAFNLAHRNIYKHEWGHSILFYFEALGATPLPTVTNHASVGQYVNWPTGDEYIWLDETDANPIPNSIYHNTSGFTHDYYSGETALPADETVRLGIIPSAWALGGPVSLGLYPTVTSVVRADANPSNAGTVSFTVTFSETVNCVEAEDFDIDSSGITGAAVTGVSGSGDTYTVTVSTGVGDGTLSIDVSDDDTIIDVVVLPLGGIGINNGTFTTGEAYTVDRTPPDVNVTAPSVSDTAAGPVAYDVTYIGATGVSLTAGAVTVHATGTAAAIVGVTGGTTNTPTILLSSITGNGTLGISIAAGTSSDGAGNIDDGTGPSATFNVDNTAPTINIDGPSATDTATGPVTFGITYAGATSINLTTGKIILIPTGTATATVGVTGGTTATPTVSLSSISGDGTLAIRILAGTATDDVGNADGGTGQSATVNADNTAPVVTVSFLVTDDSRPALVGIIDDAGATVSVNVAGQINIATNDGASWALADDVLNTLPAATYDVQVTATDALGNVGNDGTTGELVIQPLGAGGGDITSNLSPDEMIEGARLELTAPAGGTDYRWKGAGEFLTDNGRVSGTRSQTLIIDPLALSDSCIYSCQYETGAPRIVVETNGLVVSVKAPVSFPAASPFALACIGIGLVLIAARAITMRKGNTK